MCGICGVVQVSGPPRPVVDAATLDRMTDAMVHRGPDDRGIHLGPGVALGARRLSIVDLVAGHQPFCSEDGLVWGMQNGELYNHDELRRELRAGGHTFTSGCDTEILPHLYERDRDRTPERLRGKFGLAVWDGRERRLLLARDRLGVKPLYYARSGDLLVFASELKSLLASGLVDLELDFEAIDAYLTFGFVPGPRTPLARVRKLRPGHRLVVERGWVREEPYWTYPLPAADEPRRRDEEYAEELLGLLDESVRLRLMSDVPLGAMLSGGLDSSLIVGLMARHMSEPVKTFSVGFREDGESNELADARTIARRFGTDHHELELSMHEQAIDLADLVWSLDEPVADLSALGFHALCRLATEHVTVALSGQGADELLGGYKKHRAAKLTGLFHALPGPLRAAGAAAALRGPGRFRRAAETLAARDPAERLIAMSGQLEPALRARLLTGPLEQADGLAPYRAVRALADGLDDDPLPATLHIDGQLALVDDMLHYFDRTSMAHSLEVRVPFLDHRLVEFSARIPADLKIRRLTTKHVLREAARGILPDEIIDKRKIGFFRGASAGWLEAQLPEAFKRHLLDSSPRCAEFLDLGVVAGMLDDYGQGRGRGRTQLLLGVLMLEVWLSTYLPRAASPVERSSAIRLSA